MQKSKCMYVGDRVKRRTRCLYVAFSILTCTYLLRCPFRVCLNPETKQEVRSLWKRPPRWGEVSILL
jgi:hypothetical protein